MSLEITAQSLSQCGFANRPTVPMLSRMPSNELTRRVHRMLLGCEFKPDDDLLAVFDAFKRSYEERMEIVDLRDHIFRIHCVKPAAEAWGILSSAYELIFLSQRIQGTKDPLRKERLIARGREMVRDLYDRRRDTLAALDQRRLAPPRARLPALCR
jgi:hypothetical protein